jgi:hypothetical protein
MTDETKLFGPANAPVIMAWQSHPNVLPHLGTWATTRYPEEAVAYVPKRLFEEMRHAAQLGLKMAEANDLWITAETIREVLAGCPTNQKEPK